MTIATTNKQVLTIMLIAGFVLGLGMERYFLKREIIISYISQSELMELEKARLAELDLSGRQLFLGEPERAIKLIEELQVKRSDDHNIILISEKAIYGKKVKSISQDVYGEVLNQLRKEQNKGQVR